jgi:hypothetical protein
MGKGIVKLGEGNWAVKDGNLLAAKETNGRFKNTEFTVTRGTDATYVGKDGLIKTASFYNLVPYSEDFSEWTLQRATLTPNDTTSPNGTLNAYKLTHTSGSSGYVYDTIPTVNSGDSRTISVFAKYIDDEVFKIVTFTDSGNAQFNLLNGTVTSVSGTITDGKIENYGNGWYRCSCKYTATVTSTRNYGFYLDDTSKEGVHIWGAQLVEGTEALDYQYTNGKEGIPRIDFTDNTDGHLLLEPESRNLITYSEDFIEWNNSNTTDAISTINSPDGTQNATTITASGSGVLNHIISSDDFTIASGDITASIFAKKGTVDYLRLRFDGTTSNERGWYNLNNGTIDGEDSSGSAKIEDYGNGWYRCILTSSNNTASGNCNLQIFIQDTGGTQTSWEADGTENIHIWGGQVEQLEYPTSYIPTNGSTVTRDAETCTDAGEAADFNSEEGTFYVDVAALNSSPGEQITISLSGGNSNDRLLVYSTSGGGKWDSQFRKNSANVVSINKSATVSNQSKVAVTWAAGRHVMFVDGVKATVYGVGSETTSTTFDAGDLKSLQFSPNKGNTSNSFYGKVKAIRVYKEALSDTDLENLTS